MAKKERPKQAEVNIGMVGHVDAGKTTLSEALTGKWTDTHSEELKRGISIRLGYADAVFFKCNKCERMYSVSDKCPYCKGEGTISRRVSFVDAPGHETLMTTMLSGAALMQGAVLVVAANEPCPQPQTIEHLNALKISGVKNLVVAQNKIDLAAEKDALENYNQIKKFLEENGYKDSPIVPTAAHFRANIDLLIEAIEKTIPSPKFDESKPLRMHCARSFDINKPGTKPENLKGGIVGGSIIQGTAKIGDEIELSPGVNEKIIVTKISSISSSDSVLENAKPGGLIAFGTALDPSLTQSDQLKGQIIARPGTLPGPSKNVKFEVNFLDRVVIEAGKEIKVNDQLVLTIGAMPMLGIVTGTGKLIEVALKKPVVVEKEQKVAISKREQMKWRLVAYGIAK